MNSETTRRVTEQVCTETEPGGPETYTRLQVELVNGQIQQVRFFHRPHPTEHLHETVLIHTFHLARKYTREEIVERLMNLESLFREAAAALDAYEYEEVA